jgi:ribosomal protein S6
VKKYEGLFILNVSNKEEEIKDAVEAVSKEIIALGGKLKPSKDLNDIPSLACETKR